MYTIYKYTNSVNGKVYVGQTSKTMAERAQKNGLNYRQSRKFYAAIKKYGWDSFVPEVICVVDTVEEANKLEQYYILSYNSTNDLYGYNIAAGGDNHEMADESKEIISKKAIERYADRKNNPMYGRKHSEETKQLQSKVKIGKNNPMYGTKWNDNQRAKCCTKGKHIQYSEETLRRSREWAKKLGKENSKPVKCVETDIVYSSMQDAADDIGVKISTLCGHLKGRQHTCCGMHFVYV